MNDESIIGDSTAATTKEEAAPVEVSTHDAGPTPAVADATLPTPVAADAPSAPDAATESVDADTHLCPCGATSALDDGTWNW